jgi:hypothetical protein
VYPITKLSLYASLVILTSHPSEILANEDKLNVKCHLALVDGKEGIFSWRISEENLPKIKDLAFTQPVLSQDSNKKTGVYKVNECVLASENFTSEKAKQLDKKKLW